MTEGGDDDRDSYKTRLEAAMLAGNVAWWEMRLPSGAVSFHESKATVLGYDSDRFAHYEDFTDLLHPEDYERAMTAMEDHLEGRTDRYDVEYRIEAKDGTYHWFHDVGGITEQADDGTPVVVSGIVIDITERKEYAQELAERNELLTLLNRIVRHDIRNDVSIVIGVLDTISDDVPTEMQTDFARVRRAATNIVDTTEKIQAATEGLRKGRDEFADEAVSLDEVLAAEVAAAQEQYPSASIDLVSNPAVTVRASEIVSSVFDNLIENAIEHNDSATPTVEIESTVSDGTVRVTITDDGPGIPAAIRSGVFEQGISEDSAGLGLGLFIARTLVHAFGGTIAVTESGDGGTEFTVELPTA